MQGRRMRVGLISVSACIAALVVPSVGQAVICPPLQGSTPIPSPGHSVGSLVVAGGGRLYRTTNSERVQIADPTSHTTTELTLPIVTPMIWAFVPSSNRVWGLSQVTGKGQPFTLDASNNLVTYAQLPFPLSVPAGPYQPPLVDVAFDQTHNRTYFASRAQNNSDDAVLGYNLSSNATSWLTSISTLYGFGVRADRLAADEGLDRVYARVTGISSTHPSGVDAIHILNGSTGASIGQLPLAATSFEVDSSAHLLYATTGSGSSAGITVVDLLTNTIVPPSATDADLDGTIFATDFVHSRFWLRSGTRIVEVSTATRSVSSVFSFGYGGPEEGPNFGTWDPTTQRLYLAGATPGAGYTTLRSIESFVDAPTCTRDQTAPTLNVATPTEGATFQLGEAVTLVTGCADPPGGLGIAWCGATVFHPMLGLVPPLIDGEALPTEHEGTYDVTVEAVDNGGNRTSVTVHYTVAANADADGDGVDDAIDPNPSDGAGTFDDSAGTTGSIVDRAGLTVSVSDVVGPGGVRVVVGPGSGDATLLACGSPVLVAAGSDITLTCGSVTVSVAAGSARVVLDGGISVVTVPTGAVARVSQTGPGTFSVSNLGSVPITITKEGLTATVVPGATSPFTTWRFVGFSQPIDNLPILNRVKAAQAVPVKWRLLDGNGAPVTNLSAATLTVTTLGCSAGATIDQIEETTAGASGFHNLGNGYYQVNWKTPQTYANSCKTLHLDIGDGVTHDANFQFTK